MSNLTNNLNLFEIYLNYGSEYSNAALDELYMPIIGIKAVGIYRFLFEQAKLQRYTSLQLKTEEQLYSALSLDKETFIEERRKLEAIGLLRTFVKEEITGKVLVFYLNETLSYRQFIENAQLNELLKKCISDFSYKQLVYKFNNFIIKSNFQDVSMNIEWLLDSNQITYYNALDFRDLYNKLISETHLNVVISEEAKAQLLAVYKNFNLTFDDIFSVVKSSLVLSNSKNHYEISYPVLQMNIERIKMMSSCQDIKVVTKINRNYEIFAYQANLDKFTYVLNDYKQINSENYILSITKENLSLETTNVLNKLRNKYLLPDPIINVIIDYSLFKNSGRLVANYIEKIGQSINNLGINSIEAIINYLQCVANNRKPNITTLTNTRGVSADNHNSFCAEKNDKIASVERKNDSQESKVNQLNLDLDPWGEI